MNLKTLGKEVNRNIRNTVTVGLNLNKTKRLTSNKLLNLSGAFQAESPLQNNDLSSRNSHKKIYNQPSVLEDLTAESENLFESANPIINNLSMKEKLKQLAQMSESNTTNNKMVRQRTSTQFYGNVVSSDQRKYKNKQQH